ncbi:pyruvate dehydrogenase complex dihydrolipoamide acetyltransferase [Flavobacterium arcticum]|uniref:Acetyltransferase component of pyruvate dehydrogenase complex n=1 Tax=Flavobacterium arcticum TaxID=1784713 RepID=A0A345H8X7_9FLAO|nr:pyruvate dehydrogenase complex dihydrolipoamide acetyltransferase [Flavobacterium arcticum]AXG73037.1 pyruvate dehydrogenase complex dihydrolipoamide acetyltransferase [Flavobacterium arcticum]KAF2510300.1 pyruvate dehydrogenase complex dihydrolipoamide acetyltransferase [Flavobacterium arcticum]
MAKIINMPRLSDTMEEGTVATWLKSVGDTVNEGDILAEIETDKATMEFEAFDAGTLLYIGVKEGDSAPVDSVLAIIGKEGEDYQALLDGKGDTSSDESKEEKPAQEEKKEDKPTADKKAPSKLPEGVIVVTMPRLSDTMEEGTVATWLKKVGDKVDEGDILAEIETDKATMEFESFNAGTLLYIGVQEGESAPVDTILAIIGPEGTDVSGVAENYSKDGGDASDSSSEESKKKSDSTTSTNEEPKEADTQNVTTDNDGGRIFASPLARKIAEEKGINLSNVKGTGENGRIVKKDIENYTPQAAQPAQQQATSQQAESGVKPFVPAGEESTEEVKNSQMRKAIARSLGNSKFTAPEYSLTIELDMDAAIASRGVINALPDTKVSFNDMVIKASAMALRKHPQINTQWKEDVTVYNKHISIGVAVAVDEGLVVPVLKFTDHMSLSQIGANVKDLAGKARNKKLQPKEMEGSTFTVSNLGMFGITEFTSIINQPNSAILSVGAIVQKPVVKNGEIVVGNTMTVTLTCDHRTVDGATGAQFLQTLKQYIENPVTMLA